MTHNQHQAIIRNCSEKWSRQHQVDTRVQACQKLGPDHVIALLENAAFETRSQARELSRQLAQQPWRVDGTVHSGSPEGASSAVDDSYIALSVSGRRYHLRCKQLPVLHVVQITA